MNGKDEKQTVITVPCTKAQRHIFYVHAKKKGRLFTAWCLDSRFGGKTEIRGEQRMTAPTPTCPPSPVYGCHLAYCAQLVSYPAADLYWAGDCGDEPDPDDPDDKGRACDPGTFGWYCFSCIEVFKVDRAGPSLKDFLDARENTK